MRLFLFTVLCVVALKAVVAESENEVKRGEFPFMAFLYYMDETILDGGARFTRSAALIRNDWLISSGDVSIAFPQKTLLARLGAINIDTYFTLNEDEEEQEREIISILRPYNYSATEWWKTDISLLKTLLPFNMSSSVALLSNFENKLQNCYILVFARRDNATERTLIQINVEPLPKAKEHCGNYYKKETMLCAEIDKSNTLADPNFCKGNSGGPLLCDSEYVGSQTYINDCKQPHLYQFVPGWNKLIRCAEEERYLTQACADVCIAITKDPSPSSTPDSPKVSDIISDMLDDTFYTQSVLTELVSTHFNTDASESSTASKVEEFAAIKKLYTEVLSTKMKEEQRKLVSADTSISIDNFSHDTTLTSTDSTYAEKDAMVNTTEKHDRKNLIEAKQQLVRVSADTSISIDNFSHDTTLTSTDSTYAEKDAMVNTTEKHDRKNLIEAKQQLVRGEASLNISSLFHYLMSLVLVLAYT